MTLENIDKTEIDAAISRAMSLSPCEIAEISYEEALYLWRNLVFVAERLEILPEGVAITADMQVSEGSREIAKQRALLVNRADELFYIVSDFEVRNPYTPIKPLNVFVPMSVRRKWTNSLLARDKGYTPYFLSRATGGRCVFFFANENDPLPVAEAMPDAEIIRQEDDSPEAYETFIKEHIDEIDILATDDIGYDSFSLMQIYKSLKPEGKILHVTDINRYYYELKGNEDIFGRLKELLTLPEAYTAASHLGRDVMNVDPRFPSPVFFNSNAYLTDKNADTESVTADKKENIIMTAGRIGSSEKNIMPLIRAFAHLADDFPDWKLVLAGGYEESELKNIMNNAFRGLRFSPDIFSRIILTGKLSKTELYKYYAKAKLFTLTSPKEGGTPNVFSEALANGCFMVIPDRLDAAPEMTYAFGYNIGIAYEAKKSTKIYRNFTMSLDYNSEAVSLATTIAAVIPHLTKEFFEAHIEKCKEYIARDFDYRKNSIKLMHLLCD
jgi:glycosyltransferase involved in cell wall biosynthesis